MYLDQQDRSVMVVVPPWLLTLKVVTTERSGGDDKVGLIWLLPVNEQVV